MLGVDHTANTTIHLGEYMRRARYWRKKYVTCLKRAAYPGSITLRLITSCQNFSLVDGWLESVGRSAAGRGRAEARLVRSSDVIRVVMEKFNRTRPSFSIPSAWMKNVMMRG